MPPLNGCLDVGILAAQDPRPSLEERYPTHEWYVHAVSRATRQLRRERLLLEEDVQRYIDAFKKGVAPQLTDE